MAAATFGQDDKFPKINLDGLYIIYFAFFAWDIWIPYYAIVVQILYY